MSDDCWRRMIEEEMERHSETLQDIVHAVAEGGEAWMETKFDAGYGKTEGCRFTVWTRKRVYFPTAYDGSEDVASVPRDPCDVSTSHLGGSVW